MVKFFLILLISLNSLLFIKILIFKMKENKGKRNKEKIKVQSYRSKRAPKLRLRIKPTLNYRMFRKVDNCGVYNFNPTTKLIKTFFKCFNSLKFIIKST